MYKLSMFAISLWLVLATSSIQASGDTSYLGMSGLSSTVVTVSDVDDPC